MAQDLRLEHVKSVRSSSLLLISTCLLVLSVLLFAQADLLDDALRDLGRLDELRARLSEPSGPRWLADALDAAAEAQGLTPTYHWDISSARIGDITMAALPSMVWHSTPNVHEIEATFRTGDSLQSAAEFWDRSADIRSIQLLSPLPIVITFDPETGDTLYENTSEQPEQPVARPRVQTRFIPFADGAPLLTEDTLRGLSSVSDRFDLQGKLAKIATNPNLNVTGVFLMDRSPPEGGFFPFASGPSRPTRLQVDQWPEPPTDEQAENADLQQAKDFILIPASHRPLEFDLQSTVLGLVPDSYGWKSGSFSLNFPELDEVTAGLQDLPMSSLRRVLEVERSRTGGTLSAFGIELPVSAFRTLGATIILIVYGFYYCHLSVAVAYWKSAGGAPRFPWIGTYPDPVARFLFATGTCVLPALALLVAAVASMQGSAPELSRWLLGITGLAIAIITVATCVSTVQLWMMQPPERDPLLNHKSRSAHHRYFRYRRR